VSRSPSPLYREIASTLSAIRNCREAGNKEWEDRHSDSLKTLVDYLPSGSGIDSGVTLDEDKSGPAKLVFTFGYHHMNEHGFYDGWTDHVLTVRPSFDGIDMSISGRDRNDVKDYLYQVFDYSLRCKVVQLENGDWKTEAYGPLPVETV
jgi:hypothetical protein